MGDSPFDFAPLGDQRDHHEHYTARRPPDFDYSYVAGHPCGEIGRLRQQESMLEAQIEVLELTIARLRAVCDAAYTVVREDDDHDWTAWQVLVCALEDAEYKPHQDRPAMSEPDFRRMGDPLNDRLPPKVRPDRGLIQSADDMSPDQIAAHNATRASGCNDPTVQFVWIN